MAHEAITIETLDEYYAQYPEAERVDRPDVATAFNSLIATYSIQVIDAPENPEVGEVTMALRLLP